MITTNTKQEQGVSILEIFLQTSDMPWTIYVNTKLEQGVSIPGIFLKTSDMPWAIKLPVSCSPSIVVFARGNPILTPGKVD